VSKTSLKSNRMAVKAKTVEGYASLTRVKLCRACGKYHRIEEFRRGNTLDGLSASCAKSYKKKEQSYRDSQTEDQRGRDADRHYEYKRENPVYYKMYNRYRYLQKKLAQLDAELEGVIAGGLHLFRGDVVGEMRRLRRDMGTPTGRTHKKWRSVVKP